MRIRFGNVTLADSIRGLPLQNYRIHSKCLLQIEDYPEGSAIEIFDRVNDSNLVTFQSERQHKDDETAFKFATLHKSTLPRKDVLTLEGSRGGWRLFLIGAGIEVCDSSAMGCRSFHSYQFIGGLFTTKKAGAA